MRWIAALALSALVSAIALAADEPRELRVGRNVVLATLRLPDKMTPQTPLVVITHGTLAHKDMETIQGLAKALTERGLATLAHNLSLGLDRRTGMYDCAARHDYRMEDAVAEIDAWVTEAGRMSRHVWVLGHSRGANQVARYLISRPDVPVEGAVLLAPATRSVEVGLRAAYDKTYGQPLGPLLEQANKAVAAGQGQQWMSVPGFIYCRNAEVTARAFAAFYAGDPHEDTAAVIANVKQPILVLAAAQDTTVPDVAASFAPIVSRMAGRARLETIEDADHFFRDLVAEDAADRIARFVAEQRKEAP